MVAAGGGVPGFPYRLQKLVTSLRRIQGAVVFCRFAPGKNAVADLTVSLGPLGLLQQKANMITLVAK